MAKEEGLEAKKTPPTIFWDSEETLAFRPGRWRAALTEVLDEHEPGHKVDAEQFRPYLRDAFPWHKPDQPHHHLSTAKAWWSHMETILARAYQGVGFDNPRAKELARLAHKHFVDPKGFLLFDDAIPALEFLGNRGWQHVILSNHTPELPEIVKGLGLSPHITLCLTSASIGYEKPNPEAFRLALTMSGNPGRVWMIGDNLIADVRGAESSGLHAILVRSPRSENVEYYAHGLLEAVSLIENTP